MVELTTREILLEYVSPLLGAIFANLMFAAPLKDVHQAVQSGSLGYLNPTPWAVMTGNTIGWITYSYLLNNYFIFWANAPGFIFSIWLNMAAVKLQYCDRLADRLRDSFVDLVESKKEFIHQSIRQSLRQSTARNHFIKKHIDMSNNEMGSDPFKMGSSTDDKSNLSLNDVLHGSLKQSMKSDDVDLEYTLKQSNQVIIDPLANSNINATYSHSDGGPLDLSFSSEHSWHAQHANTVLKKITELGTMAMKISIGRMEAPAPHEKIVVGVIVVWFAFISCIIFVPIDTATREFIVGIAVNVNMSFFYGAPLSIIWRVVKTKDSSWIHRKTMIMNTLCALFFFAFGFGRMDYFLIVPNGIGILLGGVQLFLRLVVPSSSQPIKSETNRIECEENELSNRPVNPHECLDEKIEGSL